MTIDKAKRKTEGGWVGGSGGRENGATVIQQQFKKKLIKKNHCCLVGGQLPSHRLWKHCTISRSAVPLLPPAVPDTDGPL